jgi:hypothetical protein
MPPTSTQNCPGEGRRNHHPVKLEAVIKLNRIFMCFVILALVGCAQPMVRQDQAPYTPNAPANNGNMSEHGGGDGGGGGGGM